MIRKPLILVVDDMPDSLLLLSNVLAAEGYEVRPADSGELALASAAAIQPNLILLDIRMPGLGGIEVCRRLKSRAETRDVPVILISASAEVEERVEGWKAGAVDYVSKPFEQQELLARVNTRLELSRLQKSLQELVAERTASLLAANEQLQAQLDERIRAERALRESEARFRNMADTVSAVIWTADADAKVTFCNQYALTFTGRTLAELTGDQWKGIVHPDDLDLNHPPCLATGRRQRQRQAEFRMRRGDGEYRWMLDTATPRLLEDGALAGYVGIAMDITELKRNQEQFVAAQKLESLGIMVAGVAHRFNNLMGTVIAEADLAASEVHPGSAAQDSISRISDTAMKASEIVALLMAYAGRGVGPLVIMNLSGVVGETVRLFKATVPKKVVFDISLKTDLPPIRGDASGISQIVLNLLSNASEALSGHGGSIGVSTSVLHIDSDDTDPGGVKLEPGEYVLLTVTDNGCGIRDEERVRIFDPFYTTKDLGRGLGLAAVQGIVRTLRGAIRVRSAPGKGSTFEVLFAVVQD